MDWRRLATAQGGVVTTCQLRSAGLSQDEVDALVRRGVLARRRRGVHALRGAPATRAGELWAAVLAYDGVLGFGTATHHWDMVATAPALIDVIVAPDRRLRTSPGIRLRRTRLRPCDVVRLDGLPVTTRAVSAMDYLGILGRGPGQRFADRAFQQGWLGRDDIARRLASAPRRPGNARLRQVLAASSDGAAAHSERVLHRLLRGAGFAGWQANLPVRLPSGARVVLDVAFPALRLAIEIDGWAFHSDVDRFQADRARQNALVAAGWTVLRFTWADITQRPDHVIAMIAAHTARAG